MSHASMLERARNDLALKTGVHDEMFRIGSAAWAADLTTGILTFDATDGRRITAPLQVIGTLDSRAGTWLWGWDHPSVPPAQARHAQALRAYGEQRALSDYTTRLIACDQAKAWDFTALAGLLNEAQGAYRGPDGTAFVFMTFGTLSMSQGTAQPVPKTDLAAGLAPVEAPEVLALVRGYCDEILRIQTAHAEKPKPERDAAFEAAVAAQQPVYERYWRRSDEYWRPCSVSSPPEYDPAITRGWAVYARGPDRWRVTYIREIGVELQRGFDVERFSDGLKITDAVF